MKCEIVIIDDDPEILSLIDTFLRRSEKYTATCFTGATDAIDYVNKNEIKIVLVDIHMREMFGNDVVRTLVELSKGIHVIIVTATSNYLNFKDCYCLGARDFVLKPFNQEKLLTALDLAHDNISKWERQLQMRWAKKRDIVE